MIDDHYVNFLADVRRRDEEIHSASEHRAAKDIPARSLAFLRQFQKRVTNFVVLLINFAARLECRYASWRATLGEGYQPTASRRDPC
jgi:hypothetical protein